MARYAEGTKVSVDASRGEISGILAKHGVVRMAWATEPSGDMLQFELSGHAFRLDIARPDVGAMQRQWAAEHPSTLARPPDWRLAADAEWRRRWRANVLLLKAKLEFIDSGDTTLERELLPYMVLKDGRTLGALIASGGLPLLTSGSGS